MKLRRLTDHVKAQNWFAVGLDLVIVVLGVFIGIQVANWNQSQADKRLGRAYVDRLQAELANDLVLRRNLVAYYAAVLASIDRADALLADADGDPQATVIYAYRASEISNARQMRATWDEIVSSGHVGLLPRDLLASGIAAYYESESVRDAFEDLQDSRYRLHVRALIPLTAQKAIRAGCSDVRDAAEQVLGFMADCRLQVPAETLAATAAALRADPQLKGELHYQYSQVFTAWANIRGDVVFLERALAAIKGAPPAVKPAP
ncbi:MAG: hypothetical protein IT472_10030 [Thermomonas sp.]|uniref:DUF6090 family protein n=1 Tax=Thermomonas sp. TaxID=1971895 RepID=UPI00261B8F25|nr:DUF6090 family protein [Thermomonas sp.]MCC7097503.1 hypothetical protein [Thermomonas sp.]